MFFSGVLALCLCNFLWIWGTGVIGTARVAIFNNVSPVFAVATAYFLLGEKTLACCRRPAPPASSSG